MRRAGTLLPLQGKRILVTRTEKQSGALSQLLKECGGEPVEMPVIQIEPTRNQADIDAALQHLDRYDWIVLTSANAVDALLRQMSRLGISVEALARSRVAAIGTATARSLSDAGISIALMPDDAVGESLLDALIDAGVAGRSILLPRAEVARETLPDGLRAAGADVTVLPVYRTVPARPDPRVIERIQRGEIDIVTLTSSSTARNLARMLGGDMRALESALVACIGPVTADTAREIGIRVDVVAEEQSVAGLVAAICEQVSQQAGRNDG